MKDSWSLADPTNYVTMLVPVHAFIFTMSQVLIYFEQDLQDAITLDSFMKARKMAQELYKSPSL